VQSAGFSYVTEVIDCTEAAGVMRESGLIRTAKEVSRLKMIHALSSDSTYG
jgi:hypothetical protein